MHMELPNDTVVTDLIDERHHWKEDIICQHFSKEASERILQTPLPRIPQQDILIWKFDKHGSYSVKSGYQLALKQKFSDNPGCSDTTRTHWEVVWAKEIPEKVKVFMWRAAKNLLPTATNLWKRKMIMDPICKRCSCRSEDVFHALLECRVARKLWKVTEFYEEVKQIPHQDMLSLLQEMASKRTKKDVELIIAVCWAIWYSRNCFIFYGKEENPLISVA
ncbi:zf-RVT domain-containing protein [Citrus sinensis]|uniref:Zf-RVT domain-containing protein n=1 Tax=Citrus sinensis TaxID=2711 RepID=A0ACB8JL06_CITSI|nr:zf-RVT domain-containing protein [Citrus sinensis]